MSSHERPSSFILSSFASSFGVHGARFFFVGDAAAWTLECGEVLSCVVWALLIPPDGARHRTSQLRVVRDQQLRPLKIIAMTTISTENCRRNILNFPFLNIK
jgi:hypothetical protein